MEKLNKKKERTKEELNKSIKTWKTLFIICLIVFAISYLIPQIIGTYQKFSEMKNQTATNQTEDGLTSDITNGLRGFVYGVLDLKYPYYAKILIVLGLIYLVMIFFNVVADIIHLVLLGGLAIFKLYKWIRSKFKKELTEVKNEF